MFRDTCNCQSREIKLANIEDVNSQIPTKKFRELPNSRILELHTIQHIKDSSARKYIQESKVKI